MFSIVIKSIIFSLIAVAITEFVNTLVHSENYLSDIGGLEAFASVFGTLYGIMTAFIVFEVWGQYNRIYHLIGQEALGLERLFRLTLHIKDKKLSKNIKRLIRNYCDLIIKSKFKKLGAGERNPATSSAFRKIANEIRKANVQNNSGQAVFDHIINHYEKLSETRTERVDQSLIRLPKILKLFLYVSSAFMIILFIIMPFDNINYGFITVGMITFVVSMILLLVEDLDNPFKGYWNITPEPFGRALNHIEKDYAEE